MKDKILVNKVKLFMNLKQNNNLMMNLILIKEYFQVKVDLVKLKNVKVTQIKYILNYQIIIAKFFKKH